jgi:outer membrane receptor protein involved in Fe transport
VQEWREPTGRFVVDWSPILDFTDETLVYASFSHGYKGGGANPPKIGGPAGLLAAKASGGAAPATFEPEFINAYEVGTKNTLFGGAATLNFTGFYYDYTDYQISKIVDRSAANENFDAEVWGLELEAVFAPSLNWQFNAAIGYLNTEVASGEESIDLMDRTDGGNRAFVTPTDIDRQFGDPGGIVFDEWMVIKPFLSSPSNCVVPVQLAEAALFNLDGPLELQRVDGSTVTIDNFNEFGGWGLWGLCPSGNVVGNHFKDPVITGESVTGMNGAPVIGGYTPEVDAPNGGAGFFKDLSGNELPNAPQFTVALGGQYNFDLSRDWQATARVDYYWQDESFARIYNTEYDRLRSWSNTNLSFWVTNPNNGITVEAYVKNVFGETPITGTFLNSDDSGLTTNVFTLDPRLIGVSIRKEF